MRNRQRRMSNDAESGEEHSIIWGMFMATTLNAATFMGKNFSTIQSVVKNWTQLSLISDPVIINLQRTKVYVFSDSVLCLGKVLQQPNSNEAWKNRVAGARSEKSYRDCDAINAEPSELEWNIFPGFTTLQAVPRCKRVTSATRATTQGPIS